MVGLVINKPRIIFFAIAFKIINSIKTNTCCTFTALVDVAQRLRGVPIAAHPLGNAPVWVGYNPSGKRDDAAVGGAHQLTRKFYPRVQKVDYNVDGKAALVLKTQQLVHHRRIEWDQGAKDIPMAMLMVYRTTTPSGRITYRANRSQNTGHADVAWALMHALDRMELDTGDKIGTAKQSILEFF